MIPLPIIGAILEGVGKVIDRAIPDPAQKAAAQIELIKLQQNGEIDLIGKQLSAIIAEAQSDDPFTSRARPSFLYVMYICILSAIPFGLAHIWWPAEVAQGVIGFQILLNAIPEEMWWLFGTGYLGYTGARTYEKGKGAAK